MLTSIENPRLPRSVRDWVVKTILEDYEWNPHGGAKYNRAFGLNDLVRELLFEASTRPEFVHHAAVCIARANAKNPRGVVLNCFRKLKSRKERYVRIEYGLYARYNEKNMFMSYCVEFTRKKIRRSNIRRHVPGTLEQAISYRDRLLAVLDGPNPKEWRNVPLLVDE